MVKQEYIQPALHIVLLQHQSHLLVDSVHGVNGNVGLNYRGAGNGDARTKENDWGDIWDE